jgi:hypothetical protein
MCEGRGERLGGERVGHPFGHHHLKERIAEARTTVHARRVIQLVRERNREPRDDPRAGRVLERDGDVASVRIRVATNADTGDRATWIDDDGDAPSSAQEATSIVEQI